MVDALSYVRRAYRERLTMNIGGFKEIVVTVSCIGPGQYTVSVRGKGNSIIYFDCGFTEAAELLEASVLAAVRKAFNEILIESDLIVNLAKGI